MGSSDSESECFESAEESLDEKEGLKDEKIKLKRIVKTQNEASKPVVSDCSTVDSVDTFVKDNLSSSVSYRKRPERVKRLPNRTQTDPSPKSHRSELNLKTDKIVPDVFLQDITSTLSKNINKSLSTLQQTSCNVKDLILNSLPVSSVGDNETFSYDDKTISFADENEVLSTEVGHLKSNPSVKSQENIIKESIKNIKEILGDETSNLSFTDKGNGCNNKRKSESNTKNNLRNRDITADDKFKNKAVNVKDLENYSSACLDLSTLKVSGGNNCSKAEAKTTFSRKAQEVIQDSNDTCLKHENFEILAEQEETKNKDINIIDSVIFMEGIDQETEICEKNEKVCVGPKVNSEVNKVKEILEPNKFLEQVKENNSENNLSLDQFNKKTFKIVKEEKSEIDTAECNLEELKMALKNIVNEETISTKGNVNLEVKNEVYEDSGEGWNDFDISDNEIERCECDKGKNFQDIKTNDELTRSKSPISDTKPILEETEKKTKKFNLILSEKNLPISIKSFCKNPSKSANSVVLEAQDIIKESYEKAEKPEQPIENNIVESESWDWDNWDEIPENKEVEGTTMKKSEIKKDKDNSLNVRKWSGWDTFGQKPQEKQENWSLGSWGVDALLHKATAVTQGISSVLEAGLGAPDPETLARMEKIERENLLESKKEILDSENECCAEIPKKNSLTNVNIFPVSGITSLVAGVTSKIVEHSKIQELGSKVISGGLDTLETFGKKTMEVLQEGDPGLKNKRALLLGNNKPILSQVLKEARENADRESKKVEEKELARKYHFETLFDDFQGMVHLEALEMLSRQCELKLDQIRSGMNSEEQEDLNGILEEVEQLCSLDEYETDMKSSMLDFKTLLQMAVEPLKNEVSVQNMVQIHEDVNKWLLLSSDTVPSFTIINQKLVSTLAELTAATVHQFHKSGELLSVKECRKTVEEVDAFSRLTNALCNEINKLGEKFIQLSCSGNSKNISDDNARCFNEKVNGVMKNSIFYIKHAFDLLIPVIQLGAAV